MRAGCHTGLLHYFVCLLVTTARNQHLIREEIKNRLNSGNACCHPRQNLSSVDTTHLAEDREQWRALVNTVINLRVPITCWEFSSVGRQLCASEEGLSCVELDTSSR
jgi:hypothetical protein